MRGRQARAAALIPATVLPLRAALAAEFAVLFVGVPAAMAAFFGRYDLYAVMGALALAAATLLSITPGFRWRIALHAPTRREIGVSLGFVAASAAIVAALVLLLTPHAWLWMPRQRPELWLLIVGFYPWLSALPQELMFRTLFFERYGALFARPWMAVAANGAAFGLSHLFFMNPVAISLTTLGGAALGWIYLRRRSLLLVWALHAIGGLLIFTLGLGGFFYHGAVGRAW